MHGDAHSSLSARRAWTAKLDDGTELLIGKTRGVPIEERVRRWVESYPLVTERMQRLASVIDLRYPNGYTVRSLELLADAYSRDAVLEPVALRTSESSAVLGARESAGAAPTVATPVSKPKTEAVSEKAAPKSKTKSSSKAIAAANKAAAAASAKQSRQATAAKRAKAARLAKAKRSSTQKKRKNNSRSSQKAKSGSSERQVKLGKKPTAAELKEIRRAATRRAAARHAARARKEAAARRKAAAQKRSDASTFIQPQPTGTAA